MTEIYEALSKIKSRPGMYIGKPYISILRHFLVGYQFARSELGIELTEEEADFYEHFHDWVQRRFNVRTNNSWANIILLFTRDEKDAFEQFFKLLDEFKQRDKSLDGNGEKAGKSYMVVNGKRSKGA
ncbi:hypothetical protein [Argonema antarcticum]|uniref:hypothetical protein n=1 Tax=Argonema antarcticum TaxID=2942763 RepID=UPI0020116605|nr:hypothetical protein [Argonema antarcticum]MCL1475731.1 hypothetical protein [Argonema antarcticum A004/B2]